VDARSAEEIDQPKTLERAKNGAVAYELWTVRGRGQIEVAAENDAAAVARIEKRDEVRNDSKQSGLHVRIHHAVDAHERHGRGSLGMRARNRDRAGMRVSQGIGVLRVSGSRVGDLFDPWSECDYRRTPPA
jgi:hypothetical protein